MSPLPQIKLSGKYADLIPLTHDHAEALVSIADVSRGTFGLTNVPCDLQASEKYIQQAVDQYRNRTALPFAIVERASGKVTGTTRFLNIEFWDFPKEHHLFRPSDIPHVVEIGATWIGETYQRTGINTDAKLRLLTYAFEEWRVLRVSFKTDARNERSRANIERVGAKFDGVIRAHMPSFDGRVRDSAFYSILQSEWPGVRERLKTRLR